MKCPKCKEELREIVNSRLDGEDEIIPVCTPCKTAYRHPDLGWRKIDGGSAGPESGGS